VKEIRTKSTSRVTAEATDIVLRESESIRLIFRPTILDNRNNVDAAVKGVFLYQRKSKKADWEDFETIPLNSVKAGEGYKLELKSAELLLLIQELKPLYALHKQGGVPRGEKKYVQATPQLQQLAELTSHDAQSFLNANTAIGSSLLYKLLNWAVNLEDPSPLIERLVELNPDSLNKLNAAVGMQSLKNAINVWEKNEKNPDEEFWQKSLTEHSFVLEQVFSWPTSIVDGKAYIGGKNVFNKSGNIVDFLLKNRMTQSAALVEIKTPMSPLLGAKYRGTYNVSPELSGSIMQTLNYKHSLQEDFQSLTRGGGDLFDSLNPQCAVIIGNAHRELDHQTKIKAFELFRHQFPGLTVFTFDELFDKTRHLIKLLESEPDIEEYDDDIPF
jgi:hypothetical protein